MMTYVAFTWIGAEQGAGVLGVFMSEEKAQRAIEQAANDHPDPARYYKVSSSILDLEPSRKPLPTYSLFDPEARKAFDESMQRMQAMIDAMPKPEHPPIPRNPLEYIGETTLGDRQMRNRSRVIEHVENCMEWGQAHAVFENAAPDDDKVDLVCREMVAHLENHKPGVYDKDKEYADAYIHQQAIGFVQKWLDQREADRKQQEEDDRADEEEGGVDLDMLVALRPPAL